MGTTTDWGIELQRASADLQTLLDQGLPETGHGAWFDRVEHELWRLGTALFWFGEEIDEGLYDDVIDVAPRLAPGVRKLRAEQSELTATLRLQLGRLQEPGCCPDELRTDLASVLHLLDCHNHHAVGLVYDAYDVDLGGQG